MKSTNICCIFIVAITIALQEPVGCVSETLVAKDKGLPVEFKDEEASQQPSLCWETCKTIVNASLALLG